MSGEVDHVLRPSLPWRNDHVSECGRNDPERTITRAEFAERLREQGQKRSAMTTCMTCWETARRWPAWTDDPVGAIAREFYGRGQQARNADQLRNELRAIEALVEAHRGEFERYLAGLAETTSLDQHRRHRRRGTTVAR